MPWNATETTAGNESGKRHEAAPTVGCPHTVSYARANTGPAFDNRARSRYGLILGT